MAEAKRVLIVGAGASGLAAIKECLVAGLVPVCFEADSDIGGLWRYSPKEAHSSIYRSTVINTSKEMMNYSDFPIPSHYPTFMHNTMIMEYFRSYVDHFGLLPHIHFNTRVCTIKPCSPEDRDTKWEVAYVQSKDGKEEEHTEVFEHVVVASGHHYRPSIPTFTGQEAFQGPITHSHSYKEPMGYEDKKVLVVGIGNSGVDIAVELSRIARQIYLSTRSGAWISPRWVLGGVPLDHFGNCRLMSLLPLFVRQFLAQSTLRLHWGDTSKLGISPRHGMFRAHPTINGELIGRIITGSVCVRPDIRCFTQTGVVCEDGSEVTCDAVILCTGYQIDVPFLDPSTGFVCQDNHVRLYKNVFPVRYTSLAFSGMIQPLGAIMPMSEMQCRWACAVWSGRVTLPDLESMDRWIDRYKSDMAKRYVQSKRHTIQVDYLPYMEDLAGEIGCRPSLAGLLATDPYVWWLCMVGPSTPTQYRLRGHGAWPGARDAIIKMNTEMFAPFTSPGQQQAGSKDKSGWFGGWGLIVVGAVVALWMAQMEGGWWVVGEN